MSILLKDLTCVKDIYSKTFSGSRTDDLHIRKRKFVFHLSVLSECFFYRSSGFAGAAVRGGIRGFAPIPHADL